MSFYDNNFILLWILSKQYEMGQVVEKDMDLCFCSSKHFFENVMEFCVVRE